MECFQKLTFKKKQKNTQLQTVMSQKLGQIQNKNLSFFKVN